jgi:integrase
MRADWPGLKIEQAASGLPRYRVRVEGNPAARITIPVGPESPYFREYYHAARQGRKLSEHPRRVIPGSIAWLVEAYIDAMPRLPKQLDPGTIKQRSVFLQWLRAEAGEYAASMPKSALIQLMDKKAATPGAAVNFLKSVRAMYAWAIDRDLVKTNPTTGIKRTPDGGGAIPWTLADLAQYREYHAAGTVPHRALTLFMFTACRIGDAFRLGPGNEIERDGGLWLDWQPAKKGSSRVTIPMMPPLVTATRGLKGPAYLVNEWGVPFASSAAFGNAFRDWVVDAGMVDAEGKAARSSHGIRKAAGELLALHGATQYHIMAVHGHSNASTSEIYTRGAERAKLAGQAMQMLDGMAW